MNISVAKTIKDAFLQLLKDLNNKEDLDKFFKDFLEADEYQELIKRLAVIYWLRKNRPIDVIKNNLGVTDKYIDSIKKKITTPGVKLATKYMEAEEFANVWSEKINKYKKAHE